LGMAQLASGLGQWRLGERWLGQWRLAQLAQLA
jgi:hypothetical protein